PGVGLRDNTYTNVLVSWVAQRAGDTLKILNGHRADDLRDRLGIADAELALWTRLSRRLAVGFHSDGILTQ
ncbi:hypothetical protein, partial [Escherichia coli]|uniref:hypothetical protein n=1 Tax=Escherichia coli TaxID=562 RepID=UPI003CE487A3